MVDKVDRPEARRPYEIREAKQTKEDQHYQHNPREDAERQYKEQLEGKKWDKFDAKAVVIKPIKVPREHISKILFRSAKLFKGVGILQFDVIWKDGRKTKGALIRLKRLEDFFQLKKFSPGTEVPESFWGGTPQIEMGIPQAAKQGGSFEIGNKNRNAGMAAPKQGDGWTKLLKALGILDRSTGKMNWGDVDSDPLQRARHYPSDRFEDGMS